MPQGPEGLRYLGARPPLMIVQVRSGVLSPSPPFGNGIPPTDRVCKIAHPTPQVLQTKQPQSMVERIVPRKNAAMPENINKKGSPRGLGREARGNICCIIN